MPKFLWATQFILLHNVRVNPHFVLDFLPTAPVVSSLSFHFALGS